MSRDGLSVLGVDDLRQFDEIVGVFLRESRAECALLVDRAGRMLTAVGDTGAIDQITFASLAAADFSASDQLAVLLGESEFSSLYHHGDRRSMFLVDIGGRAILAAIFDGRTTLGMVRIKTKTMVPRMNALLAELDERGPRGNVVHMDAGWAEEVEGEIDRLFTE